MRTIDADRLVKVIEYNQEINPKFEDKLVLDERLKYI